MIHDATAEGAKHASNDLDVEFCATKHHKPTAFVSKGTSSTMSTPSPYSTGETKMLLEKNVEIVRHAGIGRQKGKLKEVSMGSRYS